MNSTLTLKSFVDQLADRAEQRGYKGSIVMSDAQKGLLMSLARRENSVHPQDDAVISVPGYAYMSLRQLKSGAWFMRYHRFDA